MKKNELLLLVLLAVLLSLASFLLSLLPSPLQGGATSETATVSIDIVVSENDTVVPASGIVVPVDSSIRQRIVNITALTQAWGVNFTLFGAGFPSSWSEAEPNSSQAGNNTIEYLQIDINASTTGGSYNVYFNVTQAELGNVDPSNISLIIFDTVWTNLTTVVVNGTLDPAQFYGVTTHFSKFLVAEKPEAAAEEEEEEGGGGGAGPGGGGGGGGGGGVSRKPSTPADEVLEEVLEKIPQPIHKPGLLLDVSILIPEKYRKLLPGERVLGEISLINIKKIGLIPVEVNYQLQDADGNVLLQFYETKTVENEFTYIKELELPDDLKPGYYMFFIQVTYEDDIALAGYPFEVISEEPSALVGLAAFFADAKVLKIVLPIMGGLIFVIIVILCLMHWKKNRPRKPRHVSKTSVNNHLQKLKSLYREK